jgi:dihydropteroate synthase
MGKKFPHDGKKFSTLWKTRETGTPGKRLPPILMGILNLTPDSFSDGGAFLDPEAAVAQALRLKAEGADMLDIGAESTRPGHTLISEEEELARLLPVLDRLAGKLNIPISVDTSKANVARAAFNHGADILNDVAALSRPGMLEFARSIQAPVILMHGIAHTLNPEDTTPTKTIADWFASVLPSLELSRDRIVLDPGIGFNTTRAQDAAILQNLGPLTSLGFPLLIGLSRKRIVRDLHPDQDRDEASAQMSMEAWIRGASVLRLHQMGPVQTLLKQEADS